MDAVFAFLSEWILPALGSALVAVLGAGVKNWGSLNARQIIEQVVQAAVQHVEANLRKTYGEKLEPFECVALCKEAKNFIFEVLGEAQVYKYAKKLGIRRSAVDFWLSGMIERALREVRK